MAEAQAVTDHWRKELENMRPEWQALFPTIQALDRFKRVVATAVGNNPELLMADRRSLWSSATMAAQDGLCPDGREGAMVIYNVNLARPGQKDDWRKVVRWMPMIAGILKKVRASGEILEIAVRVVRDRDQFDYQLGDQERIVHKPELEDDPGQLRFVYSIVKTKDGGVYREVMSRKQIDKVRASSRAKKGPWSEWYDEMAQKTCLRKQSKILPMGDALEEMFQREEAQSVEDQIAAPVIALPRKTSAAAKRDGDGTREITEIRACRHLADLEEWWAMHEAEVNSMPNDHWITAIKDAYEVRQEELQRALDDQRQGGNE